MTFVRNFLALVFVNLFILSACNTEPQTIALSDDGTWCWFSDPRAIMMQDNSLLTGFVTEDGSVASLLYNFKTNEKRFSVLNEKLEVDDHNNPAFLQRNDGHLLAFYTEHHSHNLYMNVSVKPNDASSWEPAVTINPNGGDHLGKY
ncbi:MAG: BNR-4 repeat-containing protein, partial [Prolixibacteraceae bacterium]|nr:BNR-4 repeat-containing protein [Prolixibacteraceae bacterium]